MQQQQEKGILVTQRFHDGYLFVQIGRTCWLLSQTLSFPPALFFMQALVVLTIFALHILLSSAVAAQQQLQQLQIPIQSSKGDPDWLPSPFTVEWVQLLEQFYNTFGGHRNASREEDECPVEIPEFACDAFYWHDGLDRQRSARHLRPQVK